MSEVKGVLWRIRKVLLRSLGAVFSHLRPRAEDSAGIGTNVAGTGDGIEAPAATGSDAERPSAACEAACAAAGLNRRVGPTEVRIDERRELELSRLGFICLLEHARGHSAVVFTVPSLAQPRIYDDATITSDQRVLADLSFTLAAGQFVHGAKQIEHDCTLAGHDAATVARRLNAWLAGYVADDSVPEEISARSPLRAAWAEVEPAADGTAERVRLFLQPRLLYGPLRRPFRFQFPGSRRRGGPPS
jgi:hypothetical protein